MTYLDETLKQNKIQDLIKQSEKRGFIKGNIFKDVHNREEYEIDQILYHHDSQDLRNTLGGCIYFNGKWAEITSYKPEQIGNSEQLETPKHYDNSKGTLYKVATERGWNSYLFDIVKRLERAEKKGEFKTDLEKSINVIKLWLQENGN
jgi:serine protease inhibitor